MKRWAVYEVVLTFHNLTRVSFEKLVGVFDDLDAAQLMAWQFAGHVVIRELPVDVPRA